MLLDPRLSVYLFRIGQKLHRHQRVHALMKCPGCNTYAHHFTPEQADRHVMIKQRIFNNNNRYKDLLYCVIDCNGYWIVDPETLGMSRGNWVPLYEVIKRQLAQYAKDRLGWEIERLTLEEDNKAELAGVINGDGELDAGQKADLLKQLDW